jgi:glycosyltransferase involved in cell wall biosynthesis
MNRQNKKILFVCNVDWFFLSHRLLIAKEALNQGYEVAIAAEDTGKGKEIESFGFQFYHLPLTRSGVNPFKEIVTLINIYKLYKRINPDVIHHITIKPIIYGSLISRLLGFGKIVNAVSGLGYNFIKENNSLLQRLIIELMKFGFKGEIKFIFQNRDDYQELKDRNVFSKYNSVYFIKGSGVDLNEFCATPMPNFSKIKIVLAGRMLIDKGVHEFYEAAMLLKPKYFNKVEFRLAGIADINNRSGISIETLKSWSLNNYFKWIGHQSDVSRLYRNSHIVILPSYREGIPRSLIEACASGRAIITTDAIGCKECVDEGVNGLKVKVKDSKNLALAIENLINEPEKIVRMGNESRLKAEREFDIKQVVNTHLNIYNEFF